MSQFGTIGTLHPCTGHPSCSQFNATDIVSRIETKTFGRSLQSPLAMHSETKRNVEEEYGIISPPSISEKIVLQKAGNNRFVNGEIVTEEATRRYVEVSPGVWS